MADVTFEQRVYNAVTSGDLDLGSFSLNAESVNVNSYIGLSYQFSPITGAAGESRLAADSMGNPIWKNGTNPIEEIALKSYVDSEIDAATVGLLDDRGGYNASTNLFPSTGGSGSGGVVLKGDLWTISVSGTLGGVAVTVGDVVRALVDSPAQTASNWSVTENNLGYVPENSANKSTSTGDSGSNTKYPVWLAIVSYFSATQIRSILGISTLSGANTGDETNGTILSKLGYTPANKAGDTFTGVFGYGGAGVGGTVTQITNKSTAVTLNKITGEITMSPNQLNSGNIVSFTCNNNTVTNTDVVIVNHAATGTFGAYTINGRCGAGTIIFSVRNNQSGAGGNLSEAIVIRFAVIKATNA